LQARERFYWYYTHNNTANNNNNNDRSTSGLFDPNRSTRANCALAQEHVEDSCHFFEDEGDYDEGVDVERMRKNDRDGEASPWLDVDNLRRAAADDDDDDDVRGGHTAGRN